MNSKPKQRPASNAGDRIFRILECLSVYPSLNLDQIAQKNKVPMSSALRFLKTCVQSGYVELMDNKRYRLSNKMFILSHTYMQMHSPIIAYAHPFLEELCYFTNETAHLGILSGNQVLYIDKIDSPLIVRLNSYVGYQAPLHSTAIGKILLAWSASEVQQLILKRLSFEKLTKKTITSKVKFIDELNKVRGQGYAVDNKEQDPHLFCIGVPVFDVYSNVVAAVSLSIPSMRYVEIEKEKILKALWKCGKKISEKLGKKNYTEVLNEMKNKN